MGAALLSNGAQSHHICGSHGHVLCRQDAQEKVSHHRYTCTCTVPVSKGQTSIKVQKSMVFIHVLHVVIVH